MSTVIAQQPKISPKKNRGRRESTVALWIGLSVILFISVLVSMLIGSVNVGLGRLWSELSMEELTQLGVVLRDIRLPRTILGIVVGASLGLSGAAMQGFLRNPLAEPGLMGVSGGAALGAVAMLYTGIAAAFPMALPLGGLVGALIAVILVYLFAGTSSSIQTLILAGVAVNSIAGAGTALALNLSPNPHAALEIAFWIMGSLSDRSFSHVVLATPIMFLGWVFLLGTGRGLNALSLGEETAHSMGFRISLLRTRVILGTALSVGAAVAVTGSIAFVGLVVPHLFRPFVGGEPGKLLGISALGGANLILWADIAVRLIPTTPELKLGVLTALVGAPFFLILVMKMRKQMI